MNTTLPLVDNDLLWSLDFINFALESGLPQYKEVIQRFHTETDWGRVYSDFVQLMADDYSRSVESLKLRIPTEVDELIKAVDAITEDLVTYRKENKMSQAFFM